MWHTIINRNSGVLLINIYSPLAEKERTWNNITWGQNNNQQVAYLRWKWVVWMMGWILGQWAAHKKGQLWMIKTCRQQHLKQQSTAASASEIIGLDWSGSWREMSGICSFYIGICIMRWIFKCTGNDFLLFWSRCSCFEGYATKLTVRNSCYHHPNVFLQAIWLPK